MSRPPADGTRGFLADGDLPEMASGGRWTGWLKVCPPVTAWQAQPPAQDTEIAAVPVLQLRFAGRPADAAPQARPRGLR